MDIEKFSVINFKFHLQDATSILYVFEDAVWKLINIWSGIINISIIVFIGCVHTALKSILNSIYYHNMPHILPLWLYHGLCIFFNQFAETYLSAAISLVDLHKWISTWRGCASFCKLSSKPINLLSIILKSLISMEKKKKKFINGNSP